MVNLTRAEYDMIIRMVNVLLLKFTKVKLLLVMAMNSSDLKLFFCSTSVLLKC